MNKKIFLTALLLTASLLGTRAEVDPNFYIYICFGQSNMEGNAQWEAQDVGNVDERFQMLATCNFTNPKRTLGNWYKAECPIVSPVGKLGPTDYFGRTMVKELPDKKIGVIAVAMGGSPIEMFDKDLYEQKYKENYDEWWAQIARNYYGENPYGRIIEMAKKAQEVGVIKGILLHQGESNNGDEKWPGMVKKIYKDMLNDLGLRASDVHIFVGETEYADMGGGCSWHNHVVAMIPDVIPTGHVVSAEGIPGNGTDPWHFSAAGYRTFGKRYAEKVLDVMLHPEAYKKYWEPDQQLTTVAQCTQTPFAIVSQTDGKALYCPQGTLLSYDDFSHAFDSGNEAYLFKMQRATGGRRLRLIAPDGSDYVLSGNTCYLNSPAVTGENSFVNGVGDQNGYDIPNGAIWEPQYVEGKGWALKNVGTGKYLQANAAAKYDEPAYFTFCTLKQVASGILTPATCSTPTSTAVYDLHGRQVSEGCLRPGLYIRNGRKFLVR